jgi:His-Xaa-Ser system radical SAM maturase HxsC
LRVLDALKERFPETCLYLLTNGRLLAYWDYATALAGVGHRRLTVEVPLYADTADLHDRIVGAAGAFDQAIAGLYNLARLGQTIRLRVVLGKETLPRLGALMEFVYRNLPFVAEVALMGMEPMGYVKKNWDRVWIDPLDYAAALEAAVRHGALRGMPVSLFNLPLCLLPRGLWAYARKSISDYKNVFLPECDACSVHGECSGMFASERLRHGLSGIRAVSQHS